jgi:hypothetical protein
MTTPPDPELRALLRRADAAADLSPVSAADFAAGVHARLQADTHAPLRASRGFASQLFPLAAALALAAALGAGSALAYARERDARTETFAAAYVRNIDPWQKHASLGAANTSAAHRHP